MLDFIGQRDQQDMIQILQITIIKNYLTMLGKWYNFVPYGQPGESCQLSPVLA